MYLFKIFIIRIIHKICDIKRFNYLKSGKKSSFDNQVDMAKFIPGEATPKNSDRCTSIDCSGLFRFLPESGKEFTMYF